MYHDHGIAGPSPADAAIVPCHSPGDKNKTRLCCWRFFGDMRFNTVKKRVFGHEK